MKNQKLSKYLKAYENNTLTPSEKIEFYRMVSDLSNKEIIDKWLTSSWDANDSLNLLSEKQSADLLQEIIESSDSTTVKRVTWRHKFKWIAAASIVVFLSSSLFLINRYVIDRQSNIFNENISQNQDIQSPNSNYASIKLSTGEILELDKSKNGEIVLQEGVKLEKLGDGQIQYSKVSGNNLISDITNTLINPSGSQSLAVELSDGTRIFLNAGSSLTYPVNFTGNERRVELKGEAFFEVAKDKKLPFIVSMGGRSTVKVLGTEFNVKCYDNEPAVLVTLVNGSVQVATGNGSKSDKFYKLIPGEQAILNNDGDVSIVKVDLQEHTIWKENIFYFNDTRLESIANSLMRWYGVEIKFKDENLKNSTFCAIISRKSNISTILNLLKKTGTIDYEISDSRILIKQT